MKTPTRSPTHADIEPARLAAMGLELEDIADGALVSLPARVELAEAGGRPASHDLAAIALASELRVGGDGARVQVRACAGTCQRWGALDLLDHLAARLERAPRAFAIAPVACLDRCDQAPACELHAPDGTLVLAPATADALDEALSHLSQ